MESLPVLQGSSSFEYGAHCKTGQKQLLDLAKSERAKTNNSNAYSLALILLLLYPKVYVGIKGNRYAFWIVNAQIIILLGWKFKMEKIW